MPALQVVPAGIELPFSSWCLLSLRHSETGEELDLILDLAYEIQAPTTDIRLLPGIVCHRKTGRLYCLNQVVTELPTNLPGVWYTALYTTRGNQTPHFFRPLHTFDGSGWLDPVADGGERFHRVSRFEIQPNPVAPVSDQR